MTQALPDSLVSDRPAGSAPAPGDSEALSIRRVAKRFGEVQAVSDGSLSLR